MDAHLQAHGPSGPLPLSANSLSALYTVLADSSVQLSSNTYGYNQTLSAWKALKQDPINNALVISEYEHQEVHAGEMYTFDHTPGDITAGASANVAIVTPNTTKWAHFTYEVVAENETSIYVYEDVTYASGGVTIPMVNKNRNSSATPGLSVHHTPGTPSISAATKLRTRKMGSGRSGGATQPSLEFILKQNAKYLLQVVNDSTSTGWIIIHGQWYEHTNVT